MMLLLLVVVNWPHFTTQLLSVEVIMLHMDALGTSICLGCRLVTIEAAEKNQPNPANNNFWTIESVSERLTCNDITTKPIQRQANLAQTPGIPPPPMAEYNVYTVFFRTYIFSIISVM